MAFAMCEMERWLNKVWAEIKVAKISKPGTAWAERRFHVVLTFWVRGDQGVYIRIVRHGDEDCFDAGKLIEKAMEEFPVPRNEQAANNALAFAAVHAVHEKYGLPLGE